MFSKDSNTMDFFYGNYPLMLNQSKNAPSELHIKGSLPQGPQWHGIAMVGTRRPGNNAQELCRRLVLSLKGTGAVIVSGLAQGIDSLCHEAALEAGLPTIAVLAQGLETHIEGSRGELAHRILEAGGALVSQFPPDTPAYKGNFPARNKVIAGLCEATIIVQSKNKGGALITAECCIKEGRKLLAIPGDFDSEVSSGPNFLLDQGRALPVFRPESLCGILGLERDDSLKISELEKQGCQLSEGASALFNQMKGFRKTFTQLEQESGFKTPHLLAILTELEISGLVQSNDNFLFYFNGAY